MQNIVADQPDPNRSVTASDEVSLQSALEVIQASVSPLALEASVGSH